MVLRAATLSALLLPAACGGSVGDPGADGPPRRDTLINWIKDGGKRDAPRAPDGQRLIDLTAKAGAPCTYGKCGPNLICMANICLKMCAQPMGQCNDKVAACAADEACMYASDFTDSCYPATAKEGQSCSWKNAVYCVGGTLCVEVGSKPAVCLRLCKYGCPAGSVCQKTNPPSSCEVCVK
jgi:hypothetical protein